MVAHAYLTELFGCALEDGFCELEFAARCRAWAKKRYAEQVSPFESVRHATRALKPS